MNLYLIINICILILCAGFGIWEARRLASRHPGLNLDTLHHQARYIYIVLAVILITFTFIGVPMMNRTLMWQMPLWFDVYGHPLKFGLLIGSFAFLFSLASAVGVMTRHPERKKIIVASIILVFTFPVFQYQYTNPVHPQLTHIKMKGVIFQSHPSSCAAASAANIAEKLGVEKTEKEMAELMNTSEMIGTNAGQIIHAMEQVGVQCSKHWVDESNATHISTPALFFIDNREIGPESHAVAFMGMDDGKWEIWDPLEGKQRFTSEQLKTFWHGKSLECSVADQAGPAKLS
jgi:predicted double-glycine peptidase